MDRILISSMKIFRAFLLAFVFGVVLASGASFEGVVVKVSDGDTLTVDWDGFKARVRLAYIDAPEKSQEFGPEAREFTRKHALKQRVQVKLVDLDRYGRFVAVVELDDGTVLNLELVRAGLAWVYRAYKFPPAYKDIEDQARKLRRGLWVDENSTPPWEWRRKWRHRRPLKEGRVIAVPAVAP